MIGVYLGFALNNFGEERKTRKQFNVYREMLRTEIKDNIKQIDTVQQYHIDMRDGMQNLMYSENIVKDFSYFTRRTFKGVRPAFVNRSAYETGIQTGMIQEFKLETVQQINKTFTMQKVYTNFTENMIQTISSKKFPETEDEIRGSLRLMIMNLNDIQSIESQLVLYYSELLETLE